MSPLAARSSRRLASLALPLLLALSPSLPVRAQPAAQPPQLNPQGSLPQPPARRCGPPPEAPQAPQPPQLSPAQHQQHLQNALSLNAEQARQLGALLHQAHEQHQPPDEAALAKLLTPEQRQRLRAMRPPRPERPPQPPGHESQSGPDCVRPSATSHAAPSAASRPAR